jgi:hypothetical protein
MPALPLQVNWLSAFKDEPKFPRLDGNTSVQGMPSPDGDHAGQTNARRRPAVWILASWLVISDAALSSHSINT